jgi:hypothetical protein
MTKLLKLTLFTLSVSFCSVNIVSADPLLITGNNLEQTNTGTSLANQTLANIFNSTVANGAAGNTFTVSAENNGGNYTIITSNNVLQQQIGSTSATQNATNIINSSASNYASGNSITFTAR